MSDNLFIRPKSVEDYVSEFKTKVIEEMKIQKTDKLEIELEKVQEFFKFEVKKKSEWTWLPKRFRDELVKQGIKLAKRRGYTTAFITLME